VQAAGWTKLFGACAINDSGQITGLGVLGTNQVRFYLLSPVEPAP